MSQTKVQECKQYNSDNVFKNFKIIEFPVSFVGLSTTKYLDVEVNLRVSAYLKTMCENRLMKFEDAREVSAPHRAFQISPVDDHTVAVKFEPKTECLSKVKNMQLSNRFVIDLRLIQADGIRCCNNEFHSEIGRYYICGEFECCDIKHDPKIINFGNVIMNSSLNKYVRIINKSTRVTANVKYIKAMGFEISPSNFFVPPNCSKRLTITIKPTCLQTVKKVTFQIRNHVNISDEIPVEDNNFLTHSIRLEANVVVNRSPKNVIVESMHKLSEKKPEYTYLDNELTEHIKRNETASSYLMFAKLLHAKKPLVEKIITGNIICGLDNYEEITKKELSFCNMIPGIRNTYDLNNIFIMPFAVDFGRVGISSYGERNLTVKNNNKYDTTITLHINDYILYSDKKMATLIVKLKAFTERIVTIFCKGFVEGNYKGAFEYSIDNKYHRKHLYSLQVGNPSLMILEKSLKFGMVTTDNFVTSVPVRIYNYFNVSVDFQWSKLHTDTPFEIIPFSGSIPKHSCKICDITYNCKTSKIKTHEVDLITENSTTKIIPLELNVITRKISIKFLQQVVIFKDIALNVETVKQIKLENSSREVATFHVVEPLIPGIKIIPMNGTIRPKTVMTFEIIVKISCILEFAFDVYFKINNKENIILPINGNIVETKLIIHPKNIYMSRVPCNMITYVPVTFQNTSTLKTSIEIIDTGDDNIFNIYTAQGNEKHRIFEFSIDGGQTKTVFVKVFDIFRREYEMYIPFRINGLLGPPDSDSLSTELHHYIGNHERCYKNNPKVKLRTIHKEITYCRITGVITVPWIQFSVEKFEIDYVPHGVNAMEFTMTNISAHCLNITILTSKLAPNFTLDMKTAENQILNETNIKFELDCQKMASFFLKFHPKGHGRFVSTAILYLDKQMTIPYFNLTFIGKRQTPVLTPSTYRIIFPPCRVGENMSQVISLKFEHISDKDAFTCKSEEGENLSVEFLDCKKIEEGGEIYTLLMAEIKVSYQIAYARNITLNFNHECGSSCDIDISFCFTYCPVTLHSTYLVPVTENPYPYYPLSTQTALYSYLENCCNFLENWMFQQGFRRELYPVIPDTFHAISSSLTSQPEGLKSKGINVSYLNFVRRIAGPLMKHIKKISVHTMEEPLKCVLEIHNTYKEIIDLIKSRGGDVWVLKAKFLLNYEQFVIYANNITPKCNADIHLTRSLLADIDLFNRLNKQSWIDFILQSYKVFIMDSCFFDCVCVSSQPKDITKVLMDWYNEQMAIQHNQLRGKTKPLKVIKNITTDLSDGIAIASSIMNYCTFMADHFSCFCELDENDPIGGIINNACLIIEAMHLLKMYFPLHSRDFLEPNFIQMLFLSIHLYVILPMFKPKDIIEFHPPLLRSSTRKVAISSTNQESLIFSYTILNNIKNNFIVEKSQSADIGKKMLLNVKFIANFTNEENCILLVHGYNKTRIFDTYMVFLLHGYIGSLIPVTKCKVTAPLYRPSKVDVLVSSPFMMASTYRLYITDHEPTIPVVFQEDDTPKFFLRRLNLIDKSIHLSGLPKDSGQEVPEYKLHLQLICLSTQIENSWIWLRGEIGDFFIKVTTQPRWDVAIDTLQARVQSWPMEPCSCGEVCECYRTSAIEIPHRNEFMLKSLRNALHEQASDVMIGVYDGLIETSTGMMILEMLLAEGDTNMSEVRHILRPETSYRITSRSLLPRLDHARLAQHSEAMMVLPITLPAQDLSEKYSITLTSECGMDIRTYKIIFVGSDDDSSI